jgi:hypothetical protein
LFPPPAVPTIQYHRQRTCHLSAPGIVVWLIINFIFFVGVGFKSLNCQTTTSSSSSS